MVRLIWSWKISIRFFQLETYHGISRTFLNIFSNISDEFGVVFHIEDHIRIISEDYHWCCRYVEIICVLLKAVGFVNQEYCARNEARTVNKTHRQRFAIDSRLIRTYAQNGKILLDLSEKLHFPSVLVKFWNWNSRPSSSP